MRYEDRALGCLIGGAYGDSLGAAVEFLLSDEIRQRYGPDGITRLAPIYNQAGDITDDTQLAIATAEGILQTPAGQRHNREAIRQSLWRAYRNWYASQSDPNQRRSPGTTCLSSLASGQPGTIDSPRNGSSGCGGIMRAHPIGLNIASPKEAYEIGVDSAALTHGHPNGYIPAGLLAALITELMEGNSFDQAFDSLHWQTHQLPEAQGVAQAIGQIILVNNDDDSFELIDQQIGGGGGWLGHDALAIALFAVQRAVDDPLEAVRLAVNHSGDSDSTGSIAGAIVGTIHGPEAFFGALEQQSVELEQTRRLGELALGLAQARD